MGAGKPKQYLEIDGDPIIVHTIRSIASYPLLKGILIGVSDDDRWWPGCRERLQDIECNLLSYEGGAERSDTVLRGLEKIPDGDTSGDWVLVHDAVRPLVRTVDIEKLVQSVAGDPDGGLLALPVADTLKAESEGVVTGTVDRAHLWRALTPQFFPVERLKNALVTCKHQGQAVTDEASAMEMVGAKPRLVAGHADNIKLTYPEDLEIARSLVAKRKVSV